ncbi:hypothetical protein SAMN02745751_01845 [Dethiosulfatibacter aminovorans DSM 17477]|uniref:Uncharacterized protein n=1 Tax=Dethiosulfatibacter aminovorans DSM 17477 TaxID=1121476 RepID=A0A1M6GYG3_9FIRM|nr:hypothetical protein [Dethiosulfatibacter aminovorans]SHJ14956.1 hypothetical protein SAMN02745751_01845 [Dethiosulfatibacter aminovorans DSM 17477]
MEGLYDNLLKYLVDQRGESYPELTEDKGEYIINNDYLNYFIIFMKSMRYNDDSGVEINYERLADELKLYKYYSSGRQNIRKLHMFALISMAYANEKIEDIDRELKRYCKYFKISIGSLPEYIFFSYMVKASQRQKIICDINEEAKNSFIRFSFKDSIGSESDDIIVFEKKRVALLSKVIACDYKGYPLLETFKSKIAGEDSVSSYGNDKIAAFVKMILDYLVDIRKGRINTMVYKIGESKLYNEKENSIVEHSNFGKCRIVKSIKNKEGKTIIVNTRFGCYRLEN